MANTKKTAKTTSKKVENTSKTSMFTQNKMMFSLMISVILVFIAMFYAYDVRSSSVTLDGMEERVEQNIYAQVQQLILQDIQAQYPNVQNQQFLQEEAAKRYVEVLETGVLSFQGQEIILDDLIEAQAEQAKSAFQDDNGNTYLTAIDPYFFMRYAENYALTGTTGDEIIDGVGYETRQKAPSVSEVKPLDFHIWLEAQMLKSSGITESSSFSENASSIFTLSALIATLSVIPIFIIVRSFSNNIVAFFSALLLVSVGTFVSRTTAGFVDTDAYNVLFPLLIVAGLVGSFVTTNKSLKYFFVILSSFFLGLFMWTWNSAWFIFVFVILSLVSYLGYNLIISLLEKKSLFKKNLVTDSLISMVIFIIGSYFFTMIISGLNLFERAYLGAFNGLTKFAAISSTNIWPNIESSIAELNPASFAQIISSIGGEFITILALLGLVLLILDFKKEESQVKNVALGVIIFSVIYFVLMVTGDVITSFAQNQKLVFIALLFLPVALAYLVALFGKNTSFKIFISMLLTIWMAGTIYMSLNGVRFILLLAPAFAIAAGSGFYYIAQSINSFTTKEFNIKDKVKQQIPGFVIISLLFALVFSPMYTQAYAIGNSATPNFDDAWYSAMYKINNETSQDAIITSWWDFGHFFAAVGNRGVTFDGGSQGTPRSHWVGKLLLEEDELVSVDILRMLTCGGNEAFNTAFDISQDPTGGVHINEMLYETFGKTVEEKRQIIANYKYYSFTEGDIDSIMEFLHCENPRENLVITSGDMVGKAPVWAHWGSWDFTKKYVHDNYKTSSAQDMATVLDKNISLIEGYVNELKGIDVTASTQNINRENLINQWFAPYPSYGENIGCELQNLTLLCGGQLEINLLTGVVENPDVFQYSIRNVILPSPSDFRVIENDENGQVDLMITQNAQGFQAMVTQAPLGTSLFTKLYYLDGLGTQHFEEFHTTQTQTAGKVSIWKTNFGELIQENSSLVNSVEFTISEDDLVQANSSN